jgi:hypothetical protein
VCACVRVYACARVRVHDLSNCKISSSPAQIRFHSSILGAVGILFDPSNV